MNGVHDLGGMHGFGPVVREANEPVFHADWERRTFALALATMGARRVNVDEFRRVIERMPAAHYLESSYYEHWFYALEALLEEKGLLARGEVDAALRGQRSPKNAAPASTVLESGEGDADLWANPAASDTASSAVKLRHDPKFKARFKAGDRIIARNLNPPGHTRIPRYVRGRRGVILRDWGTFVFPDTHAHGLGSRPQHCYCVAFKARELWGRDHSAAARVYVDLWESYLEPDGAPATPQETKPARRLAARAQAVTPAAPSRSGKQPGQTTVKGTTRAQDAPKTRKKR